MSNPYIWDRVWMGTKDDTEFWWWVQRETKGIRVSKIIPYLEKYLGRINGLKIIEVGCGAGVHSLILAKRGATVSLMDYSHDGLLLARKHFDSLGLAASFLYADALNIEPDLREKFDVAMSFGTVEHYRYPECFLVAKAHLDLVRPGGVVIISVPNRLFLPHEILKFYLQRRGKWRQGYEGAFNRRELLKLGNKLGLENIKIYGSGFIIDICRYLRIYQGTRLFRKFCHIPLREVSTHDLISPFDNVLGADILLIGRKPPSV